MLELSRETGITRRQLLSSSKMGNDQSKGYVNGGSAATSSSYLRMDNTRGSSMVEPETFTKNQYRADLFPTPYVGTWSIENSLGTGPSARTKHFTAYSAEQRIAYVGYGVKASGEFTNDVWALSTTTNQWRRLKLSGQSISPRAGATACMMGKYIVVFGGYTGADNYVSDLHTIDTETGAVMMAPVRGGAATPRSDAVIGIYNEKLFVWGGYNGSNCSDLDIMEFRTMTWRKVPTSFEGCPTSPFVQVGSRLLSFGGPKVGGFICVDMNTEQVTTVACTGAPPNAEVTHAGMVRAENYLFFFGGRAKQVWTMVYACDIAKNWWFVFFVAPDDVTTTTADGRVSSDGLFLLPHLSEFSTVYDHAKRQIYAFLGNPEKTPAPLFILSIGDSLGVINLREDMAAMFARDAQL